VAIIHCFTLEIAEEIEDLSLMRNLTENEIKEFQNELQFEEAYSFILGT